jgi:diaminopimelate dehydrogenase
VQYRIAIVGYGNIGRFALEAVEAADDFVLTGVVRRTASLDRIPPELQDYPVAGSINELGKVDVALLCVPSRAVPEYAREILSAGVNTVDSYDIHGELVRLKKELDPVAREHNCVSVISAGWDPGTDSMIRGIFEFMAPHGLTHTNFGPGMSMGHTVAAKAIPGVKNALAMTIPAGAGVHRRMVYVELEQGAEFDRVAEAIKADPYFRVDATTVIPVHRVERLIDTGHGVMMERKGVSGKTHNQRFRYEMRVNNPALTAQIMVAAARAGLRQKPGCYTMLEIPVIDYLYGERDELLNRLV